MDLGAYITRELIGSGNFGQVFLGERKSDGEIVAIKMININRKSQMQLDEIENEVNFMKMLSEDGDYIAKLIDSYNISYRGDNFKIIIMEYLGRWITLDDYMRNLTREDPCHRIPPNELSIIIIGLIIALEFIHHKRIAHRDIKPENIMIDNSYRIKFIDFGLACSMNCRERTGTPYYYPPETILNYLTPTTMEKAFKHDIWSLGIVIYQLTNLRGYPNNYPFEIPEPRTASNLLAILRTRPYSKPSRYLYEYAYNGIDFNDLIRFILNPDLNNRPTITDLYNYISVLDVF